MKSLTISEGFLRALDGRKVSRAFFSTYCLEPHFFELEVLPLLLGNEALSHHDGIRYFQLQELMRDMRDRFTVAYDHDIFNPDRSSRLEVQYIPVRAYGCQHAKIAVIEVEAAAPNGDSTLILAAGSFNLTQAGWWENIEVGHWVELSQAYAPANIVAPLERALAYFRNQHTSAVLDALIVRLLSLEPTPDDPACAFYFSGSGDERVHFDAFLTNAASMKGLLEVVSPFFSEDGNNQVLTKFFGQFSQVHVLLPKDERNQALVEQEVLDALNDPPRTQWCEWQPARKKQFDMQGHYRKLHAKIFQGGGKKPWVFVGSVNLSYQAFRRNVEAGFLLRGTTGDPWLKAVGVRDVVCAPQPEAAPANGEQQKNLPVIGLAFDWQSKRLNATCGQSGKLRLFDSSGSELGTLQILAGQDNLAPAGYLAEHLTRTALVTAGWRQDGNAAEHTGTLIISQRNLYSRPSSLPALSLQDLLQVFQGMRPARRLELIETLAARQIRLKHDDSLVDESLPPLPVAARKENFFAEFSRVNGAFWHLKKNLRDAGPDTQNKLDYYFKGCQPDSLRGVLASLDPQDDSTRPSAVMRYLTTLSIDELLYLYPDYAGEDLINEVRWVLSQIERESEFAQLPEGFLDWLKEKFLMQVTGNQGTERNAG